MTVPVAIAVGRGPARPAQLLRRAGKWLSARLRRLRGVQGDAGMTTAEYAVGTVAACAIAAALYKVVTSGTVTDAFNELLTRALHVV
ncbi:DUF4244 domain-containing protein [Kitasatospora sp. NPDC056138]|uniref:DUF4244 domain-containing protein n=1 Tax=Kitasatospora sp. NPDC056138 TaxID=3345724 RepID=UPI0035DFCE78